MNPHLGRSVSHNFLKGEVTLPCPDRSTCYIHYLTLDFFQQVKMNLFSILLPILVVAG